MVDFFCLYLSYVMCYFLQYKCYSFYKGDDPGECTNVTSEWEAGIKDRCPHKDWTVSAVSGVYLLFSNLLLVNLVIAMFRYELFSEGILNFFPHIIF